MHVPPGMHICTGCNATMLAANATCPDDRCKTPKFSHNDMVPIYRQLGAMQQQNQALQQQLLVLQQQLHSAQSMSLTQGQMYTRLNDENERLLARIKNLEKTAASAAVSSSQASGATASEATASEATTAEATTAKVADLQRQLVEARKEVRTATAKVEKTHDAMSALQHRLETTEFALATSQKGVVDASAELDTAREETTRLQKKLDSANKRVKQLEADVQKKQKKKSSKFADASRKLQTQYQQKIAQLTCQHQQETQSLQDRLKNAHAEANSLQQKGETNHAKMLKLKRDMQDATRRLKETEQSFSTLVQERDRLLNEVQKRSEEAAEEHESVGLLAEANNVISELRGKLEVLETKKKKRQRIKEEDEHKANFDALAVRSVMQVFADNTEVQLQKDLALHRRKLKAMTEHYKRAAWMVQQLRQANGVLLERLENRGDIIVASQEMQGLVDPAVVQKKAGGNKTGGYGKKKKKWKGKGKRKKFPAAAAESALASATAAVSGDQADLVRYAVRAARDQANATSESFLAHLCDMDQVIGCVAESLPEGHKGVYTVHGYCTVLNTTLENVRKRITSVTDKLVAFLSNANVIHKHVLKSTREVFGESTLHDACFTLEACIRMFEENISTMRVDAQADLDAKWYAQKYTLTTVDMAQVFTKMHKKLAMQEKRIEELEASVTPATTAKAEEEARVDEDYGVPYSRLDPSYGNLQMSRVLAQIQQTLRTCGSKASVTGGGMLDTGFTSREVMDKLVKHAFTCLSFIRTHVLRTQSVIGSVRRRSEIGKELIDKLRQEVSCKGNVDKLTQAVDNLSRKNQQLESEVGSKNSHIELLKQQVEKSTHTAKAMREYAEQVERRLRGKEGGTGGKTLLAMFKTSKAKNKTLVRKMQLRDAAHANDIAKRHERYEQELLKHSSMLKAQLERQEKTIADNFRKKLRASDLMTSSEIEKIVRIAIAI